MRVGLTNTEQAQILSGIASGEEVVVGEAVARISDGARIERIGDLSEARLEQSP